MLKTLLKDCTCEPNCVPAARSIAPQRSTLSNRGRNSAWQWPCGLMDKALVFGTKDCRFESCQGQLFPKIPRLLAKGVSPSSRNYQSGTRVPMNSTRAEHSRMTWNMCPCQQTGYSSVGRASDCRVLQQSDGPWFDSGWPDFCWKAWASQIDARGPASTNSTQTPDSTNSLSLLPRAVKRHAVLQSWRPLASQMTLWPSG